MLATLSDESGILLCQAARWVITASQQHHLLRGKSGTADERAVATLWAFGLVDSARNEFLNPCIAQEQVMIEYSPSTPGGVDHFQPKCFEPRLLCASKARCASHFSNNC